MEIGRDFRSRRSDKRKKKKKIKLFFTLEEIEKGEGCLGGFYSRLKNNEEFQNIFKQANKISEIPQQILSLFSFPFLQLWCPLDSEDTCAFATT